MLNLLNAGFLFWHTSGKLLRKFSLIFVLPSFNILSVSFLVIVNNLFLNVLLKSSNDGAFIYYL